MSGGHFSDTVRRTGVLNCPQQDVSALQHHQVSQGDGWNHEIPTAGSKRSARRAKMTDQRATKPRDMSRGEGTTTKTYFFTAKATSSSVSFLLSPLSKIPVDTKDAKSWASSTSCWPDREPKRGGENNGQTQDLFETGQRNSLQRVAVWIRRRRQLLQGTFRKSCPPPRANVLQRVKDRESLRRRRTAHSSEREEDLSLPPDRDGRYQRTHMS